MFTTEQYRAKAREYAEWAKATISPKEAREFNMLERSFTTLADNEQWLAENHDKTVSVHKDDIPVSAIELAAQEEHVLRCLGAALILQWNTLPQKLQRELFDNASSMGSCSTPYLCAARSHASCTGTTTIRTRLLFRLPCRAPKVPTRKTLIQAVL